MGEWTWLHKIYPLAGIQLTRWPIKPEDANVLVRLVRQVSDQGQIRFQVRVAPHNVAPFQGGPWIHTFLASELEHPQDEFAAFCQALAVELEKAKGNSSQQHPHAPGE